MTVRATAAADQTVLDLGQRRTLLQTLAGVPDLLAELDVTITRTDVVRGAPVGKSGHRPVVVPFNQRASDARVSLERALRTYALRVAIVTGSPAPHGPARHAAYLAAWLPMIPDDAPSINGIYAAIVGAAAEARRAIDRPPGRVYVGACDCGAHLYAREGADEVECRVCSLTWPVAERREWMVEQARDRVGTPAILARLMPWFDDRPIQESTIRQWARRRKLTAVPSEGGPPMYRLGDVLDLHRRSAPRADAA
ncbi:Uncharacterised protein [Mycobacteroides abscessus subsp. abscessus]|nr:Uncharacterised protein [Mycobacteroides abscessus subsp. abscessus]